MLVKSVRRSDAIARMVDAGCRAPSVEIEDDSLTLSVNVASNSGFTSCFGGLWAFLDTALR